ncbi:MAG: nicotinate (nicotinamide) nucleotide adenylyltransferase, partial [Pseudomonadota bacterium]
QPITPFHDRLKMIQLATKDSPRLEPMDLEARRQGLSYTIETLKELHGIFPYSPEFFFILGMDAFLEIETWKEYERLFDYSHFVVIERPGFRAEQLESFLTSLHLGFKKEDPKKTYSMPSGMTVICKQATLMDISSTRIREAIRSGRSIRFLVPDSVIMYIKEGGLYRK